MKVTSKEEHHSEANLRETVVSAWLALEQASAGADELVLIQQTLGDESISPAEIARELADEGVELRHPEIIICDAEWRAAQLEQQAGMFAGINPLQSEVPLELKEAASALAELERLRCALAGDEIALSELNTLAVDSRKTLMKRAKDQSLSPQAREVQAEVAEWLRVWLETPNLFAQWLELRKVSAAFITKFPDF